MRFYVIMISLLCLFIASGPSVNEFRLLVLDRPGPGMERFDPVSSWSPFHQDNESVSEIIIIERSESTCGASEEDVPGDIIQVSSGMLNQYLTIDEPELVILGLPGTDGERLVIVHPGRIATGLTLIAPKNDNEVTEICLEHFNEKGFRICPESDYSDSAARSKFTMVREELSGGDIQYLCNLPLGNRLSDQICIHQAHLLRKE